jgi:predicted Rossmann fold flavoprotein
MEVVTQTKQYDVVVLGAGAAGMMCAFEAGKRGRKVLLLEHGERVGQKILISGGGRCNFTNIHAKAENFLSENPHFAKSALARFTPKDFVALVEKHGIKYHEKTLGQLFCDDSARQIVGMLEKECAEAGVETRVGVSIAAVRRSAHREGATGSVAGSTERFVVETSAGSFACASVVVATGGLSIPKMGATGFGYELAREFGHAVIEPRAGLVPLMFSVGDRERWSDLAGLSTEVVGSAVGDAGEGKKRIARSAKEDRSKVKFREKLLITHRGLSGPAVLQVSSYWSVGGEVTFDLAPGMEVFRPLVEQTAGRDWNSAYAALRMVLPTRMAERWVRVRASRSPKDGGTGDWTNAGIAKLEVELHAWTLRPDGSEGFAKAEVTVGGVDTTELDARTMESKRVAGMYFIGEVVDVTGWLGGYNFQWAWASAVAAGAAA